MRASDKGIVKISTKVCGNSLGYTLIEMIIGLGLASVLVSALVAFVRAHAAHQGKKAARTATMKVNQTLLETVEDQLRLHTAFAISPDGKSLDITHKNSRTVFKTSCVKVDAPQKNTRTALAKAYSGINKGNFDHTKGQCISSLNCPAGMMPQVKVQPASTEFPGTGLCFQKAQNKIRVIAESVWLVDRSGAALSVVSDERLLIPAEFSKGEDP